MRHERATHATEQFDFKRISSNVYSTTSKRTGERYTLVRYPDDQAAMIGFASCTCQGFRSHQHCKHSTALITEFPYQPLTQQEIADLFGGHADPFQGLV